VVMDNLTSHRGQGVRELIEGRDCELLFLPPYWPDLNPLEEAFSKIKYFLREANARTREALVNSIGKAPDPVTDQDTKGFFAHCGYRIREQQL
jgi:transposase